MKTMLIDKICTILDIANNLISKCVNFDKSLTGSLLLNIYMCYMILVTRLLSKKNIFLELLLLSCTK